MYHLLGHKETLRDIFTRFDVNKDGRLTPEEFRRALDKFNVVVTEELISTIFAKYDTNRELRMVQKNFSSGCLVQIPYSVAPS